MFFFKKHTKNTMCGSFCQNTMKNNVCICFSYLFVKKYTQLYFLMFLNKTNATNTICGSFCKQTLNNNNKTTFLHLCCWTIKKHKLWFCLANNNEKQGVYLFSIKQYKQFMFLNVVPQQTHNKTICVYFCKTTMTNMCCLYIYTKHTKTNILFKQKTITYSTIQKNNNYG